MREAFSWIRVFGDKKQNKCQTNFFLSDKIFARLLFPKIYFPLCANIFTHNLYFNFALLAPPILRIAKKFLRAFRHIPCAITLLKYLCTRFRKFRSR